MKFTTFVLITFVIVTVSCPFPVKATAVGRLGELAPSCVSMELLPCLPAISMGGEPTKDCCDNLKEQKQCLCGYIKNPDYSLFVTSPNARKIIDACKVPVTSC
ncbi:hypothetical protein EUTSA_v10028000mg [Eutrema salsugineum]|uniref:Bifunctional inhibitor/plant lipid transfer protein/seed storage helical domain-containing protein n=1 Tax=Eutrema salsugineum TaxID=72664 RepID=V4M4N6_EUTSA|nr:non-specific lipid-transfer protein 2 [Eutrema salsugineum]ESQ47248.1 hypothetical protein EUTSA_v10028000mg [Eutrema salsugineum]